MRRLTDTVVDVLNDHVTMICGGGELIRAHIHMQGLSRVKTTITNAPNIKHAHAGLVSKYGT